MQCKFSAFYMVIWLLFIHCLLLLLFVLGPCFVLCYFVYFLGETLLLCFRCLVAIAVVCLGLAVPWVSLHCRIVALPGR